MTQTLNAPQTQPVAQPQALLGEVIAWRLPRNVLTTKNDLIAALSAAGLETKLARDLCLRHAFVRACRKLEAQRIIRKVEENRDRLVFQFTREHLDLQLRRMDYQFDAIVELQKGSGDVHCTDPNLEALAKSELAIALEERRTSDVTRILMSIFRKEAHIAPIKGGVFFVPQQHADLIAKVADFCTHLQGHLGRLPVPADTPQGDATVQVIMQDSFKELIVEAQTVITNLNETTRESTLRSLEERLEEISGKLWEYERPLGSSKAVLEDNLALVQAFLRRRTQEVHDAKEAAKNPPPDLRVACTHCGEVHDWDGSSDHLICADCGRTFDPQPQCA